MKWILSRTGLPFLAAVFAFAAGWFLRPPEVKIVETERVVKEAVAVEEKRNEGTEQVATRVITRRVLVPGAPAICPPVEERIEETGVVRTYDLGELRLHLASETTERTKETTKRGRADWRVSVSADPLHISVPTLRLGLERRILGPLWAGASYQHDSHAITVSVAGEF